MNVTSHHLPTACREPDKSNAWEPGRDAAGLAAYPSEDVGWQEGKQKPAKERGHTLRLNSLRLPNKASLLGELELGSVLGNPEERRVFQGDPTGCRRNTKSRLPQSSHKFIFPLTLNQEEYVLKSEAPLTSHFPVHSYSVNQHTLPSVLLGSRCCRVAEGARGRWFSVARHHF